MIFSSELKSLSKAHVLLSHCMENA